MPSKISENFCLTVFKMGFACSKPREILEESRDLYVRFKEEKKELPANTVFLASFSTIENGVFICKCRKKIEQHDYSDRIRLEMFKQKWGLGSPYKQLNMIN